MGCHSSKISGIGIIDGNNNIKMMSEYEAEACSLISELQSFNSTIPKLKESILNNQSLLFLSKGYLNNAFSAKKLLASFKLCILEARNMQAIILQALKCYQKEDRKSYSQTLHKLREFKEVGDPFVGLFTNEFSSLREHQQLTVKQLNSKKNEIKRKLGSTKKWKKVWKVVHNTVFMSVLVCSVVLAAISAPPLATVAATACSTAIKTAEQWIDSIWDDRLDALKNEKDVVLMMIKGENMFGVHELESIRAMVDRLEIRIGSISDYAGLALANQEEEISLKMTINDIESKVGDVGKWIDEVEMKVNACDGEIGKAVVEFLNVIIIDL